MSLITHAQTLSLTRLEHNRQSRLPVRQGEVVKGVWIHMSLGKTKFEVAEHVSEGESDLSGCDTAMIRLSVEVKQIMGMQHFEVSQTYFCPRHILAPLENVHIHCSKPLDSGPIQRSGLNSRASGPHASTELCMVYVDILTTV